MIYASPGALQAVRKDIESGHDIYLLKHMECFKDMTPLMEYPVLEPDLPAVFELSDPAQRSDYFRRARNTEAFFSFMGGLVVKRATWDSVALNPDFVGSCWAHFGAILRANETRSKGELYCAGRPEPAGRKRFLFRQRSRQPLSYSG